MAGEDEIRDALERAEDAGPPEDRPVDAKDYTCAYFPLNDYGNARRLLTRFGDEIAYHPAVGWLAWDGKRWTAEIGELVAQLRAQETVRAIMVEAQCFPAPDTDALIAEAKERGIYGGKDLDAYVKKAVAAHDKMVRGHRAWCRASGNQGKITAMLAAAAPHRTLAPGEFDGRPFIFNADNCAIHLKPDGSHEKRPHSRADLLTKLGGCVYDPSARAPSFEAFLETIQPKKENRAYLQRFAGYLLTGDISEQIMGVAHGGGANGKGSLFNAWRHVLGGYAITAKSETFGEGGRKTGSEASPDVARMRATRMIVTGDLPPGFTLNEGVVKQATGEEPLTARKLHRDDMEFDFSGKVLMPCNEKPQIRGKDDGIWRRVHLIPFLVQIPEAQRDKTLKDRLKAEASGILNWMLAGYAAWRKEGLNPPPDVRAATQDYRRESDALGEFLDVWCDLEAGARVGAKELFDKYVSWCESNGYQAPKNGQSFGLQLKRRGYQSAKRSVKLWLGLRLRTEAREDPAIEAENAAFTADWNARQRMEFGAEFDNPAPRTGGGESGTGDSPHGGFSPGGAASDPDDDTSSDYERGD